MNINKLSFGATNVLEVNLVGQTISQVLGNANYRNVLGFGQNVQAKVFGAPVSADYVVRGGDSIAIENKAQEKASNVNVTVTFGATSRLTKSVPANTTIASLLTDRTLRAALGFGDNAIAKINGAAVRNDVYVRDGLVIDIETKAQEKAVA